MLQNAGSQIQQGKFLNPFSEQLCLVLAGSVPGVSDISPHLPFPYLTLLTPIEIWGITSRPQALQTCPVLAVPDVSTEVGGFIYRHRSSKRFCTFLFKKRFSVTCRYQDHPPEVPALLHELLVLWTWFIISLATGKVRTICNSTQLLRHLKNRYKSSFTKTHNYHCKFINNKYRIWI